MDYRYGTDNSIVAGNSRGCVAFAKYKERKSSMNSCCHLSAIGTSNTSGLDTWVLPFVCMSLMVCVSVGATSMIVVDSNMTQPKGRHVFRAKSQLLFNLLYFVYRISQQPTCVSNRMSFDVYYCIIHILLFVVCCVICSPNDYVLQYYAHFV
jgi:hypothetical protein